ncbi:signal transduction histidine kinase [Nocardioides albertanoniae]|uniref:Signal transduction histidine kinase n=1 Tax=Nocardioides albertanoniae TaxID=1175486 RepID=A0A543A4U8_9ACTN|nr:histidine kinase [Nocardioides albertanoniae]TQL67557.1 signal transduction histidine kinase [Nocardioides albertanoniae]
MTTQPRPFSAADIARRLPDLAALTGVRSGKQTYYSAYQRSNERLQLTVAAMDSISGALVHSVEGPRALLEKIVRVASHHFDARWAALALTSQALPSTRPRFLAIDSEGAMIDAAADLAEEATRAIQRVESGDLPARATQDDDGVVVVPMLLDGHAIGGLVAAPRDDLPLETPDLSVLHILANLAAVSLHTGDLYRTGLAQQRRAHQLFEEVSEQARLLSVRDEELRAAEQRLRVADQRELLENERRRIALELHDSVAQTVLSAGLVVEMLRGDFIGDASGAGRRDVRPELDRARDLMSTATEQLRSVIYALNHERGAENVASLPELLAEMAAQHRPHLNVRLRVEGSPVPMGTAAEHALARTAGEALFNVAMHSDAGKALVRLRYLEDCVVLRIGDDGNGDPAAMRRTVRLARRGAADGRHRGLLGMALRAEGLGGTLSIRRSRAGGVAIESRVPLSGVTPGPTRTPEESDA